MNPLPTTFICNPSHLRKTPFISLKEMKTMKIEIKIPTSEDYTTYMPLTLRDCNYTDKGCSQCGQCCERVLPLTTDEIRRIKSFLRKRTIIVLPPSIVSPLSLNPLENKFCPFRLRKNGVCTCQIYPVRPFICRYYNCRDGEQLSSEIASGKYNQYFRHASQTDMYIEKILGKIV